MISGPADLCASLAVDGSRTHALVKKVTSPSRVVYILIRMVVGLRQINKI